MKSGYQLRRLSPRMAAARRRMDALADHVADEGTLTDFANAEGISLRGAEAIWKKIRLGMGAQAI